MNTEAKINCHTVIYTHTPLNCSSTGALGLEVYIMVKIADLNRRLLD